MCFFEQPGSHLDLAAVRGENKNSMSVCDGGHGQPLMAGTATTTSGRTGTQANLKNIIKKIKFSRGSYYLN